MGVALFAAASYQSEISEWRKAREARLLKDDGWPTVVGLFWLRDGANTFGRDKSNDVPLPDGPARAGTFTLKNGKVTLTMNGSSREVATDKSEPTVKVGRLSLFAIKRGDKYGIRLKDPESEYRRNFAGLQYYPVRAAYKVTGKFVPQPRKIPILNIIGQTEQMECPGYVEFRLQGKVLRLFPVLEEPDAKELFYIFKDLTSGKETYGAGRFLYSGMPEKGKVVLDFN
jgi:uncharacterized protein (DUF1684 family)